MRIRTLKSIALAAIILMAVSRLEAAGEAEELKDSFLEADKNTDLALDEDEFKAFIDLNAGKGIGRTPMVKQMGLYSRAFNRLDENADGSISIDELRQSRESPEG